MSTRRQRMRDSPASQTSGSGAYSLAVTFLSCRMAALNLLLLTAIVTAMTGPVALSSTRLMDVSSVYVIPTYLWPGIAGGLIMGAGFIIGGYSPGTALVGVRPGLIAVAGFAGAEWAENRFEPAEA